MTFYLLDESITTASAGIIFLQLGELELTKGLEDILEILLRNTEVNVAHVETMEGDRVGMISRALRCTNLTILLGLGKLHNDWNT
jgi:hypothetical protein